MNSEAVSRPAGPRTGVLTGSWPLGLPADGRWFTRLATRVEGLGYDLLFTGDHLFTHGPITDAPVLLAHQAAVTERIVLGAGVLLPALREPVVLAKQLATIDYFSGGRLICGVGVGGEIAPEWKAMEVPLERRGRRTDEYLYLMRRLWAGEPLDVVGEFRSITGGVAGNPSPARPGGPPIWVGGRSEAALARAARHDGWMAYATTPRRVALQVERLRELRGADDPLRIAMLLFTYVDDDPQQARRVAARVLAERYGQDFDRLLDAFCAVGDDDRLVEMVSAYRAAGVDDVLLCPQCGWEEVPDQIERWAETLLVGATATVVTP